MKNACDVRPYWLIEVSLLEFLPDEGIHRRVGFFRFSDPDQILDYIKIDITIVLVMR